MRALLLALAACGESATGDPEPGVLVDRNPDPAIVEVDLVAEEATAELLPGTRAEVWAFRDATGEPTIPGPLLEANVGDRVIVHFENRLPAHTTIHFHGVRVANAADGTPIAQQMIHPGESFTYDFVAQDPGLYWYHPHMEGDVQIERGLYAPMRVRGGVEPDVAADRVFVLDDVKLESSGRLSESTDNLDIMLGRQGNVLLVNGKPDRTLEVAAGTRERWRFVNAANGRYFNLDLPGHRFLVIGWDGGLVPAPYETDTLLIAPGERYEVLVEVAAETALRTIYYDRGHDIPDPGPLELMQIRLGDPGPAPAALPMRWADVPAIAVNTFTPRVELVLAEQEATATAPPTFSINDEMFPEVTPIAAATDDVAIWEVVNTTEMDHPFHLHGMSFQILDDDLAPQLGWKDTVNVKQKTTAKLAVRYGPAGRWMFHCHILEHAERGMMGELDLK